MKIEKTEREKTVEKYALIQAVHIKLTEQMQGMTLYEQVDFLKLVREGKIKINL